LEGSVKKRHLTHRVALCSASDALAEIFETDLAVLCAMVKPPGFLAGMGIEAVG
jgi:hypothetical protein